MQRDVDEVGGTVTGVGNQAKDHEEKKCSQVECGAEVGPAGGEPEDDDRGKNQVVEEASGLPVTDGVGPRGAKGFARWVAERSCWRVWGSWHANLARGWARLKAR